MRQENRIESGSLPGRARMERAAVEWRALLARVREVALPGGKRVEDLLAAGAAIQRGPGLVRAWVFNRLNREDIQAITVLFLLISVLMIATNFAFRLGSKTVFGPLFGADFTTFYNAGKIYNTGARDRIYDVDAQRALTPKLFPDNREAQVYLPYSRAPFLIGIFSLLARVRYDLAYLIWMLLSAGLFWAGFHLLWGTLKSMPEDAYLTSLLGAASFMPFVVESLAGGQTAALGFYSLASTIALERRGRLYLSGLSLSVLCYQPQLLLFILPMLVITRRTRTLDGFLAGGLAWSGISWGLVGNAGCIAYAKTCAYFVVNSIGAAEGFKLWKYIDANTFFRMLLGEHSALALILSGGLFLGVLILLTATWWGAERRNRNYQSMVWATCITWTLVAALFVGTFDATLAVISVLLSIHTFLSRAQRQENPYPPTFQLILVVVYVVSWVTQPIAKYTGVQLFTLSLGCLGGYQFYVLRTMKSQSAAQAARPLASDAPAKG